VLVAVLVTVGVHGDSSGNLEKGQRFENEAEQYFMEASLQELGLDDFEEEGTDEQEDKEDAEALADEEAMRARFQEGSRVSYNEELAKEVSIYAQASYHTSDPAACAKALGHRHFKLTHSATANIFDGSTVYGFTALDKSKRRIIVGFHGDVPLPDLAKRLYRGKPIKYKKLCKSCKTHKYFALVNSKICPEIIASTRLLTKKHPHYEVIITGHGFGGAVASLCGYQMEMERVFHLTNRRRFISFGQPRAGNSHWARKFNQVFPGAIRVTHGDDPITHIAPCHVDPETQRCIELKDRKKRLWAYHAPTQVWYPHRMPHFGSGQAGEYKVCTGENWGEDTDCRPYPLGFSMRHHEHYFGVKMRSSCEKILGAKA